MSAKWTAADIPDQTGRIAVVTGANSGLGLVTARELARAGAHVVVAARDPKRGARAIDEITAAVPHADLEFQPLDLADLGSIERFAGAMSIQHDGLDLLINNAGVMALPYQRTADGFELQFGTNHLGHFALTGRLAGLLTERPDSRVVTVSSGLAQRGRIDFGNLQGERKYQKWAAYSNAKLANLLFAFELDRRLPRVGSYAAHPGFAATNLQPASAKATGNKLVELVVGLGNKIIAQDMAMGALPTLYAATKPDLPRGSYVGPDGFMQQRGHPKIVRAIRAAYDEDTARKLWEVSEKLTGVHFGAPV
ncbi:NAD(P)-dependent dehydrogenase (short-subunit alcohol dehydrogenase family) [Kibdelosporangium banguiense]|uniref:NAD(P)-dependent dehydrogenase (Short-subunit alcohol dehydrogenase family) n=1 Tax=Kibdelosporangium banguiense TaxID=1365924 RepID=A0ABS4TT95_9PSEU|nr:oxidoreductase [Kibdelosporangium banguiense]MBP2327619.1 NAD(P)-dependent dehydrogenase (short-subunit alcohol dehydrogenase family) [Kibdelosporangium banguiense]